MLNYNTGLVKCIFDLGYFKSMIRLHPENVTPLKSKSIYTDLDGRPPANTDLELLGQRKTKSYWVKSLTFVDCFFACSN